MQALLDQMEIKLLFLKASGLYRIKNVSQNDTANRLLISSMKQKYLFGDTTLLCRHIIFSSSSDQSFDCAFH